MEKKVIKNTMQYIYQAYLKKVMLKDMVEKGLVINNKKKDQQLTFDWNDCIDVTEYDTLDEKISYAVENDRVRGYIEGFEYRKIYRNFCYFICENIEYDKIATMVKDKKVKLFDMNNMEPVDSFDKPTIVIMENQVCFKFSFKLKNQNDTEIKYVILAMLDKDNSVLEMRFDSVGIAYKGTYTFYKEKIDYILEFLRDNLDLEINNFDFKAVVDYMKEEKSDISIYAQRMKRNGSTAYLEALDDGDDDGELVMPILGELISFVDENEKLFEIDDNTRKIKEGLNSLITDIQVKSDLPKVKIRLDDKGIKFGIIHNYKGSEYSLFILQGELIGDKEMMSYVREYLMQCYRELNSEISNVSLPEEED